MNQARDTVVYHLKDSSTIVYIGITNDQEGREDEHKRGGKQFTHMHVASNPMTRNSAKNLEKEMLASYRKSHDGKNPKHNKDSDG